MAAAFYYRHGLGEVVGPLTSSQLRAAAADGSLRREMEVRRDSGAWKPAGEVPGLFPEEEPEPEPAPIMAAEPSPRPVPLPAPRAPDVNPVPARRAHDNVSLGCLGVLAGCLAALSMLVALITAIPAFTSGRTDAIVAFASSVGGVVLWGSIYSFSKAFELLDEKLNTLLERRDVD